MTSLLWQLNEPLVLDICPPDLPKISDLFIRSHIAHLFPHGCVPFLLYNLHRFSGTNRSCIRFFLLYATIEGGRKFKIVFNLSVFSRRACLFLRMPLNVRQVPIVCYRKDHSIFFSILGDMASFLERFSPLFSSLFINT